MSQILQPNFEPRFIAVAGPSGAGKTTILNALIALRPDRYARPLSYTSRPRRVGEDDAEYRFVDAGYILSLHAAGRLANLDSVYGHYYAMDADSIRSILASNRAAVKEIHADNIPPLRRAHPALLSVLVVSPEGDLESASTAEGRSDRFTQDADRYAREDASQFDVTYRRTGGEPVARTASNLDVVLNAVCSTADYFPPAPQIDSMSGSGYELIAPEFTESLRITTANFHTITQDFFQGAIRQLVPPSSPCLEIGPGGGWLRRALEWPDVAYVCADISRTMLLKSRGPSEQAVCATARNLPFAEGTFDSVFASLADSYCYPAALCEIRRVLRSGGSLLLSSPAREWADAIRSPTSRHATSFRLRDGRDIPVYSFALALQELGSLVELCGFEVEEAAAMTGARLDPSAVAPAVLQAARTLGVAVSDLPIVNCVHARKAAEL